MPAQTTAAERLWPILPPDDRLPFPPCVWLVINLLFAALMALSFILVASVAGLSLWAIDAIRYLIEAHVGSCSWLPWICVCLKGAALFFCVRRAYELLIGGCVRCLVREIRDDIRESDFPVLNSRFHE